jgi:hypothetical protein
MSHFPLTTLHQRTRRPSTERAHRLPDPYLTPSEGRLFRVAHHNGLQPMQHTVVWSLPRRATPEGLPPSTHTAPNQRPKPKAHQFARDTSGAEGIRTPDPLDAKGHFTSVPVASSSMVSPCSPYTAGVQLSLVTSCHLVLARVEGSVRGQMRVNTVYDDLAGRAASEHGSVPQTSRT